MLLAFAEVEYSKSQECAVQSVSVLHTEKVSSSSLSLKLELVDGEEVHRGTAASSVKNRSALVGVRVTYVIGTS